jgi:hypothetical protein
VSESVYRTKSHDALTLLATRLGEMAAEPPRALGSDAINADWFELIGCEYAMRLDPNDYRRQFWEVTLEIKALRVSQPIIDFRQSWTGSGNSEGDPVVTSGQNGDQEWDHRFLRKRPEDRRTFGWWIYLFDLGESMSAGATETLSFSETLFDKHDRYQTFVTWSTGVHRALSSLRIRIDFGPHEPSRLRRYREIPDAAAGTGYRPDPRSPQDVALVEGKLDESWGPSDLETPNRYGVSWIPSYRRQ